MTSTFCSTSGSTWWTLTKRDHFAEHSRDTFDAVLDLSEDIATKCFAPHNKKGDQNEPSVGADGKVVLIDEIKDALDTFSEAGLIAGPFDEAIGGMQLPMVLAQAAHTFFRAANPSTFSYAFLTVGNANLLAEYGTEEQIDTWVRPMLEGRYFGTMCLSEPDAGSSLADITTKAVPSADGTYRVTGTKMWITGGDHELTENIVHLVLAKAPGGGRRRQRHLAVHRPEVPARRHPQRRRAGQPEPQDGQPRHHERAAELRRRHSRARRSNRAPSAISSARSTRAWPTCST